jgi:hypothetical protein
VVAGSIVVLIAVIILSLGTIPHICQGLHGGRLAGVHGSQESRINRLAVTAGAGVSQAQGFSQEGLVACHDVCQVAEGLSGMTVGTDMNVHTATAGSVALGTGGAQSTADSLEELNVLVAEDRSYHFTFVSIIAGDGNVALEFPFTALSIPAAPCVVTIAEGGILNAGGSKYMGGNLGGIRTGDVVHFYLNPDGLRLHHSN